MPKPSKGIQRAQAPNGAPLCMASWHASAEWHADGLGEHLGHPSDPWRSMSARCARCNAEDRGLA